MNMDKEQKKVFKAAISASAGYLVGYPLLMWLFGKLDSWKNVFIYLGIWGIVSLLLAAFFVFGSRIPKKD